MKETNKKSQNISLYLSIPLCGQAKNRWNTGWRSFVCATVTHSQGCNLSRAMDMSTGDSYAFRKALGHIHTTKQPTIILVYVQYQLDSPDLLTLRVHQFHRPCYILRLCHRRNAVRDAVFSAESMTLLLVAFRFVPPHQLLLLLFVCQTYRLLVCAAHKFAMEQWKFNWSMAYSFVSLFLRSNLINKSFHFVHRAYRLTLTYGSFLLRMLHCFTVWIYAQFQSEHALPKWQLHSCSEGTPSIERGSNLRWTAGKVFFGSTLLQWLPGTDFSYFFYANWLRIEICFEL